jgi:sugar lactone lactonase YvrE
VYVSDTGKNRIYRVDPEGQAAVWLESAALQSPNGLWVDGGTLIVASWGPMTDIATFATRHPGTLLAVALGDKTIRPIGDGSPIAHFDGVIRHGADFYGTDWKGGRLLRITPEGAVSTVLRGFHQLADLGIDHERRVIGLPVMSENRLIFLHLDALTAD